MKNILRTIFDGIIMITCAFGVTFGILVGMACSQELRRFEATVCVILSFILLIIGMYYGNVGLEHEEA